MKVYELADPTHLRLRAHPWVEAESGASFRYFDFRKHPERIRTSLEDLVPWAGHPFTETFYGLIEWLNGPSSVLESNDCAFSGLCANEGPHSQKRLEASGRVMVLFRELEANTSPARVGDLAQQVAVTLSLFPEPIDAVVGVSIVAVQYLALPEAHQRGQQLMLSFWAWGDDEHETLGNLDHTLGNLAVALRGAGGVAE